MVRKCAYVVKRVAVAFAFGEQLAVWAAAAIGRYGVFYAVLVRPGYSGTFFDGNFTGAKGEVLYSDRIGRDGLGTAAGT